MSIKPWREIAKPHKDVLEGTFKQAEFAADISQVATGNAPEEYQDAAKFYSRTFITEGMRLLLVSVAQRLAGQGGDPVIQLQTAFGGGKTHTMLAVLHLAKRKGGVKELEGIPPILDEAGITQLPQAKVAVLDGISMSPSEPRQHGSKTVNSLWAELAWQLLGDQGLDMVKQADRDGTSPGKTVLIELLKQSAPCVILIDELVAFIRQFEPGRSYKAGTFDSNLSFIQALTEAIKSVPNAVLLASLPESDLEIGGVQGQQTLEALEKYFGRVESVWKPVATEEAFEIVRRRLFDKVGDTAELKAVCKSFADFYKENSDKFPVETQSSSYGDRLYKSYPIHPEIFDRLYKDWSTLPKFQRTRGVLQYMAIVIHRLWNSDNRDALIMPGSIPLDDGNVRNKSIHYLPQGWEPVIETEIDGPKSEPSEIDGLDTRFGSVQAARRAARTIFLGSASSTDAEMIRGISLDHILLGTVQPGQTVGVFEDVLKRLRDRLHYLYSDQDRLWFDTKPNLRREMESRRLNVSDVEGVQPLLKQKVSRIFASNHAFSGIHVFTPSADVPDDFGRGPRLVVLDPKFAFNSRDSRQATNAAEEILHKRGEQPRQKQNRLIFFAADTDTVGRLKEQARTYLAWKSIVDDIKEEKLNLDLYQAKQAQRHTDSAEQTLRHMVRDTYKWLICPTEEFDDGQPKLRWESLAVSTTAQNLIDEIEQKLYEEEWLITKWSPIHLKAMLDQWYFKEDVDEISVLKVWEDSCNYLYLPRLLNDHVLSNTISQGLDSEDFFGYASGKEDDKYLGFIFGQGTLVNIDVASLLIDREAATAYREKITPVPPPTPPVDPPVDPPDKPPIPPVPGVAEKKQFYATTNLDPVKAKMDFATIVDEVVEQFTSKIGVKVKISVEIQAKSVRGFDESLQRSVKENCNHLKFKNSEFEED